MSANGKADTSHHFLSYFKAKENLPYCAMVKGTVKKTQNITLRILISNN